MHLRPRNPKRDRLVNEPLAAYSYFQIGVCPWGRGGAVQGCPVGPLADCGVSTRGFAWFCILVSAFDPGCLSFSESLSAHDSFCGPLGPSSVSGLVLLDLASGSLPPVFFGSLSVCLSPPLPVDCLLCHCRSLLECSLSVHCLCSCLSPCSYFCVFLTLSFHLCLPVFPSPPGAIQSFAGFTDYFTAMAQEGWFPLLCVGLRPQWEDHHLQDLQDSYGQEWVSPCPHPLSFQCHLP